MHPAEIAASAAEPAAEGPPFQEPPRPAGPVGFIVVPAMIVILAAGIFWLFWMMAHERKSPRDYVLLLRDPDLGTRWKAALDLVQSSQTSPDLVPVLLEIIDSSDAEQELFTNSWDHSDLLRTREDIRISLRWYATAALGKIGGDRALRKLIELTGDRDKDVRFWAVHGLGRLRRPDATPPLIGVLQSDADWGVRAAAAYALGEIADPAAGEALRRAHEADADQDVRWNSAIALARFGDSTGRPTLEAMLRSDNPASRREAHKALRLLER